MPDLFEQKEFEYKDYMCLIRKTGFSVPEAKKLDWMKLGMYSFWYCGYVRIPDNHPFHKVWYGDIEDSIDCHGGLTYSADEIKGGWTIGFDCNHLGDDPHVQDELYTINECKRIVDQLIQIKLKKVQA